MGAVVPLPRTELKGEASRWPRSGCGSPTQLSAVR